MNQFEEASTSTAGCSPPAVVVEASLLGEFAVSVNGNPIARELGGPARSVLQYVLLSCGRPIARDVLMDTFWPDFGPDRARNNLNVALSALRKVLRNGAGASVVEYVRGAYRIHSATSLQIDVDRFERAAKAADAAAGDGKPGIVQSCFHAVSCYTDDLLTDEPYAVWLDSRRSALRLAYLRCLERLGAALVSEGQLVEASRWSEVAVMAEPLNDAAMLRLLSCQRAQGLTTASVASFERYRDRLRLEYDLAPPAAICAALADLRRSS